MSEPISTELAFLRYFFENAEVSMDKRAFIEEGFEMIYNRKVPESYRINIEEYSRKIKEMEFPTAAKLPDAGLLLKSLDEDYEVINKSDNSVVPLSDIIMRIKMMGEQ